MKIFIAVEDVYGVEFVKEILKISSFRDELKKSNIFIEHLRPCSSKMTRILHAHVKLGRFVVIIVDSEYKRPDEVKEWIIDNHLKSVPSESFTIIVNTPCIEQWICEILNLKNCRFHSCRNRPMRSIDEYCRKKYGKAYDKKLITKIFRDVIKSCRSSVDLKKVDQIREILRIKVKN